MIEPSKDIPVLYDVDVVVCGGGMAGCIAAIAAARYGSTVALVERFGQLGGNIGPGLWAGGVIDYGQNKETLEPSLLGKKGMGGVGEEFLRRCIMERGHTKGRPQDFDPNGAGIQVGSGGEVANRYPYESHICSHILLEMLQEAGVELLLSATVGDPVMRYGKWEASGLDGKPVVSGVYVETRSGRKAIKAKVTIDATGQADIAYRAGAPCKNQMNPNLGLWFLIGGVDWDKYNGWRAGRPKILLHEKEMLFARRDMAPSSDSKDPYPKMNDLIPYLMIAHESGEFQFRVQIGNRGSVHFMFDETQEGNQFMHMKHDLGGMMGGRTGTHGPIDFTDPEMVTKMEIIHREQPYKLARFLKKYIPGFDDAYLMFCSPLLGVRGGRHIDAEYPIGMEDVVHGRKFDDVIYSSFELKRSNECDMPYRASLPKGVDGLLVAGTGSMPYPPNFRRRAYMLLQGQALGIASALCVQNGQQPRDIDVKKLQKILVNELNCPIGDEDRLKELGLR